MNRISAKYRRTSLSILFAFLCATPAFAADTIPGAPQNEPIALVGGTIHPVSGPAIDEGTLVFDKSKIVAVGKKIEIPKNARKIDVRGRHVYPGLFEAHSQLGLVEIGAVRASRDERETGNINPNVRANVSVNPDSELIPVTRSNGVLLALTAPSGGLVSGTSAVMQLDGWTYEDMTLQPDVALHINWPRITPTVSGGDEKQSQAQIKQRNETLQQLRDLFAEARAYQKARIGKTNGQRHDVRLEALLPVIERRMPIIVHCDRAAQIQSAVAFAAEQELKLIILGGYDAPLCADLLKKHNVPVIVSAVYRLPARRDDAYDAAYTLPARLYEAEIPFCISGTETSRVWNTRNLPYHAATAAAYGLPREEALKAVTLFPAQILGVADRVGSLEAGKDATLIVTTGNPLDTTARVLSAYIQGRELDLTDRHKQLYRKYREKYRRLDEAEAEVAGP